MIKAIGLVLVTLVVAGCGSSAVTPPASRALHESTATPAIASSSAVYRVGDRIKVSIRLEDEVYLTVTEVDLAWEGLPIMADRDVGILPPAGTNWVTALVEIEGINPSGAVYNASYFRVFDEQGSRYLAVKSWRSPALRAALDLMPGEKVSGWVLFEVPDTARTLRLVYSPGPGQPVEVILKDGPG
jgi:hypothetical protein